MTDLRELLEGRCLSDITHRDEEHRQSVCMLPEGHAPLMHDDCMGCTWTDADHWQPSAVDRVADEVQRIADESQREGWDDPLVRILAGRISAALDGEAARDAQNVGDLTALDALPVGSVVMEGSSGAPLPVGPFGILVIPGVFHRFPDGWHVVSGHGVRTPEFDLGPLTVLHTPCRGAES